jgi:hypothetical protein
LIGVVPRRKRPAQAELDDIIGTSMSTFGDAWEEPLFVAIRWSAIQIM